MPKFNANKIINHIANYGDRLVGSSARKYKNQYEVLRDIGNNGIRSGVSNQAVLRAKRLADTSSGRSMQTRVKTGVGAISAVGTGFLGLHKYHQHKDNKILERIDSMYKTD